MAKTFIGELILRLRDDASGKAKQTAREVTGALQGIENAAKRLNSVPWGGGFQKQLDKLGASSHDLETLRGSWDRLYQSMTSRNLTRALRGSEIANWKQATLGHFAEQQAKIRSELDKTEKHYKNWRSNMQAITRAGLVAVGGYTGAYVTGMMGREAFTASSEWQRELFRQRMASLPEGDRNKLVAGSERLGSQYPSVSITDISEMGRNAISMMGSIDKAMEILPDLVKGMVTLQSTKGTDVATDQLRGLLRGIDNAGQNGGDLGIQNTKDIIAGMIRAAQIEGSDLDVGKLFEFARQGKLAVPGLSTDFLATTAPAIMQDMGPDKFGTALGMAYKSFIIGDRSLNGKRYIAAQEDLGIRKDEKFVGADTFARNPYQWVQETLIPALTASGVDLNDEAAVGMKVGGLSANSNATTLLTRMITQRSQIDRNVKQYGAAMGPDAAGLAQQSDPFVSYRGFLESLRNLAAAVGEDSMPTIVAGLNHLTSGINGLQQAWRDGDALTKAGITAGAGAAGFGAFKMISGVWALATAGPALNAAAVSLEAAAVTLGGAGVAGKVGAGAAGVAGAAGAAGRFGWLGAGWALARSALGGFGAAQSLGHGSLVTPTPMQHEMLMQSITGGKGSSDAALSGQRAASGGANPLQAAVDNATSVGGQIKEALSVTAAPVVETSSIDSALAKARMLLSVLGQINSTAINAISGAPSPAREMNRNLTDQGVSP